MCAHADHDAVFGLFLNHNIVVMTVLFIGTFVVALPFGLTLFAAVFCRFARLARRDFVSVNFNWRDFPADQFDNSAQDFLVCRGGNAQAVPSLPARPVRPIL